jgi:hypothetical protein
MPVVSAVPSVVKQSNQTLPIFTVYREERREKREFPAFSGWREEIASPVNCDDRRCCLLVARGSAWRVGLPCRRRERAENFQSAASRLGARHRGPSPSLPHGPVDGGGGTFVSGTVHVTEDPAASEQF